MKDWFMSREPRERIVLGVGAIAAILILFWGALWRPVNTGVDRLHTQVTRKSALLVDLERAAAIGDQTTNRSLPAPAFMVVLVDRTSRTHGLAGAFTRTRPEGSDGIAVSFQDASFDALLAWLVDLQSAQNVRVESATFNDTNVEGTVNGQILLRRAR